MKKHSKESGHASHYMDIVTSLCVGVIIAAVGGSIYYRLGITPEGSGPEQIIMYAGYLVLPGFVIALALAALMGNAHDMRLSVAFLINVIFYSICTYGIIGYRNRIMA